mgnify:CR=1 FL=1
MNKTKQEYICQTCEYLEQTGGRPWISEEQRQYGFDNYKDYEAHYERENELSPSYKYLEDCKGKTHTSCLLVSEPNHKPCPAHPEL